MKILGIESSGLVASVAVMEDAVLLGEYTTNFKKTHSQTLLPMLDQLKTMLELDLTTVDAIAVSGGPGSFTGLRIGSATAKGLGLALDIPLISVPTLEVLAYDLWGASGDICPLMDARRNQVYTGIYRFGTGGMEVVKEPCAIDVVQILEELNERGRPVIFLGDGVPVYEEAIRQHCRIPWTLAPASANRQRAGALCARAAEYMAQGRTQSAAEHRPDYLRLSQAERERLARQAGGGA
jgi:tRNA threonylcarbamoyl adenosine modification protein YeaZ